MAKEEIEILPVDGEKLKPELIGEAAEITEEEFKTKYQYFKISWQSGKDQNGNPVKTVKSLNLDYLRFLSILVDLGFRRSIIEKKQSFVQIKDNIIEEVDDGYMRIVFKAHMEKIPDVIRLDKAIIHKSYILNDMMGKQSKMFDTNNTLCHLPIIREDKILNDPVDASYFYYRNKYVMVSADGIKLMDYKALKDYYVWKDSILERDIELKDLEADQEENIWAKFLFNICDKDNERLGRLMHIIGYLLHKYYGGKMKAIVLTDSRISDDPQGRTGKGMIFKGIKHMLNRNTTSNDGTLCTIDGKDFDQKNAARYTMCTINTRIIHISDVQKKYNVENHYNEIEEGIVVKKLYEAPFLLKVKIGISTNRTLKILGESSLDRFVIFDLSDHYNRTNTPLSEFGKWFFRDFTPQEWSLFDNFMLHCVQFYLKDGLVSYKSINLENRILYEQVGEDIVNFLSDFPNAEIDDTWAGDFGIVPMREYEKKDLYHLFITKSGADPKRIGQRYFTTKLRMYKNHDSRWQNDTQDIRGNYFQERRSNGKDLIWFVAVEEKEDNN